MRYFVSFLIAIGLIILVFILILKSFSGGSNTPKTHTKPLISYASTGAIAQLTLDGPVNANQNHQAVQIDISQYQAQLNIIHGYEGTVVSTQAFANNQSAYAVFLRAIDLQGFTLGDKAGSTDPRGYCPFGQRYEYKLLNGAQTVQDFWATSCGKQGTFKGNVTNINNLFKAQIPNYSTLTATVQL